MNSLRRRPGTPRPLAYLLVFVVAAGVAAGCGTNLRKASLSPAAPAAVTLLGQSTAPWFTDNDAAAARAAATLPETAPQPLDPAIRVGRLENGLTFYIRKNARPEKRAELRLAINAGSVLEDDDQQGLAHFVEHMAFNGTARFKKQEIVSFMERIGMRFGAGVNASTDYDQTIYRLTIPTDDAGVVDNAFQILEDWSAAVSFEDAAIEKERGVLIEEWRLGRGAEARMRDKYFPKVFHGSRYAERLPIGKKEIIGQALPDAIRRFYRDWYRPDLMAVVAVGDFDPVAIEQEVRDHFGSLRNPNNPRPRTVFPVPGHDQTLVAIVTDHEATNTAVNILTKLPRDERRTLADFRRRLVKSLHNSMVNDRLGELAAGPAPPFLYAGHWSSQLVRSSDMIFQGAMVAEREVARGLEALIAERARVSQHGFTASELERTKIAFMSGIESLYRERDREDSSGYVPGLLNMFFDGRPNPDIAFRLGLYQRFLPGITLEEVNRQAREWAGERNRVIVVQAPQEAGSPVPTETQIREIVLAAEGKPVEPWVDRARQEQLVPIPPKPATITEEKTIADLGVTEWRLSNGVRVILKPTDFQNDEVSVSGFSPGGHSLVQDEQYLSAIHAGSLLAEGGLGAFDQIELEKALTGKIARANAYIGELEEVVSASAAPRDLETMFQLIHLKFTAPRADAEAFIRWKAREKGHLENKLRRPEAVFSEKMDVALTQGHFRRRPMRVEMFDKIDQKSAEAIWRDRFADAGDFTFVIVGNFKPEGIRPLVLTYFGGLPSTGRRETWKDIGVRPPPGIQDVEVRKGLEPKSQVQIVFTGETGWSREDEHIIASLSSALRIRLREELREDKGAVYGVGVGGSISRRPTERYRFSVSFDCDPERVAELEKALFDVFDTVKKEGFNEEIVQKVREQQTRGHETALKENWFWLSLLEDAARFGDDPHEALRHDALVRLVTAERLRDAASRYFDMNRRVVGVLYPESSVPLAPTVPAR